MLLYNACQIVEEYAINVQKKLTKKDETIENVKLITMKLEMKKVKSQGRKSSVRAYFFNFDN